MLSPNLLLVVVALIAGIGGGYFLDTFLADSKKESARQKAEKKLEEAEEKAKDIVLEAKDKAAEILSEIQDEKKEQKEELKEREERLDKREERIEEERKEIDKEKEEYEEKLEKVEKKEKKIEEMREDLNSKLEEMAELSKEEAKEQLMEEIEEEYREEISKKMIDLENEKKEKIKEKSLEIVTSAIQRYSRDHISDITTTTISIPDEDMKGKIIGRDGRNIRAFERQTGVEVIVDDAPESITLSSFNPLRRELAKIAMKKLIDDGRIQPARIEEKVEEAREELENHIDKVGEEAAYEAGVLDLPDEIIHLLGKLKYRTSYGQNVLDHSIEMTHIAGTIAAELGIDVETTKKAALLHDIGKAIDHEVEGTHVELGRKLLKKYDIEEEVIKGMESHHEDYPFATPESYIVAAADAISGARPGARRDTLDEYLERIEEIENIANEFEEVEKAYALSAGREVRAFVVPEEVDDYGTLQLANKISNKLQSDVQYPGEIKVTVIREVRAVEHAK
ncbi:MAG: ribonuclease Y [Candidatus Magasanikbacteria bacterium]